MDEIRNEIENRAGFFFHYEAVTNAVKREWKKLVTLNDNNEVILLVAKTCISQAKYGKIEQSN